MRRLLIALAAGVAVGGCAGAAQEGAPAAWHLVPGTFAPGTQPDGNSVFIDAPEGLILVDTGRHAAHQEKLLAHARSRGRPVAAIVNTHWHLDHSTGNGAILAAYPRAQVHASTAIDGALKGFLARSRDDARRRLDAGEVPSAEAPSVIRFLALMDDPASLRPTRPVARSGETKLASRRLQLNLAPFAATEGDVWLYDPELRLLVAGDLVVAEVPFMDTACAGGWRQALDALESTPFETLVPGHGAPMDRAAFARWRTAFVNLLDCAASDSTRAGCIAGWRRDAAEFIAPARERLVEDLAGYYLDTRLRAPAEERERYCRPQG
jgi:glyoxylase-like metal-dependent hydrolase (beta-lactamase superfamily II)